MEKIYENLGIFAAVTMPLWNIPLMARIIKRKTSEDLSLVWVFGIWGCIVLMLPSSLLSDDPVLRAFGVSNALFFSLVVMVVLKYRKRR